MFTPSTYISPSTCSKNLNNNLTKEDFPAPVLPIIPIFSPGNISIFISFNTFSPFSE